MGSSRKRIFITGMAGFIGSYLARRLIRQGDHVVGCDNFNAYYDPELKKKRAKGLNVVVCDINDGRRIEQLLEEHEITHLVHLAAQPGVRYSLENPKAYKETNLDGFFSILEALRKFPHIRGIFASSSSVYGLNERAPFCESDPTDHPANFYSATKKANETLAFSYHHLYGIPMTILRLFTVYGPMGRPDMAYFKFAKAILQETPIDLYNQGKMARDFTYIDDIIDGIARAIDYESEFTIFNLGNSRPEPLFKMVHLLEEYLEKKAQLNRLPMQPGEMPSTCANIERAKTLLGYDPKTSLEQGLKRFTEWLSGAVAAK